MAQGVVLVSSQALGALSDVTTREGLQELLEQLLSAEKAQAIASYTGQPWVVRGRIPMEFSVVLNGGGGVRVSSA